jgi:hypothetical protein
MLEGPCSGLAWRNGLAMNVYCNGYMGARHVCDVVRPAVDHGPVMSGKQHYRTLFSRLREERERLCGSWAPCTAVGLDNPNAR